MKDVKIIHIGLYAFPFIFFPFWANLMVPEVIYITLKCPIFFRLYSPHHICNMYVFKIKISLFNTSFKKLKYIEIHVFEYINKRNYFDVCL